MKRRSDLFEQGVCWTVPECARHVLQLNPRSRLPAWLAVIRINCNSRRWMIRERSVSALIKFPYSSRPRSLSHGPLCEGIAPNLPKIAEKAAAA